MDVTKLAEANPPTGVTIELHEILGLFYWVQRSGHVVTVYGQTITSSALTRVRDQHVLWSDDGNRLLVYP